MRHLDFNTTPAYVEIHAKSIPTPDQSVNDAKLRSALARLGSRWVLAPTRTDELQQLRAEGWDLV